MLFARPPEAADYEKRLAGIRAHNAWMKDFCDRFPEQRAGIGLRGGVLLPNLPPDCTWLPPLHDPVYDPVWAACEERGVIVNLHGGTGTPDYGAYPASDLLFILPKSATEYFHQNCWLGVSQPGPDDAAAALE